MATQAELVRKIRRKSNELGTKRYTDNEIREAINEAGDDAARRTQCLRTTATQACTNGVQDYATPDDLITLHAVQYQATGQTQVYPLEYHDYKNAALIGWNRLTSAPGAPGLFWTEGSPPALRVHLYPIPTISGTLLYHYYKTFDQLDTETGSDNNTTLPFPPGWDDMLADYAMSELLLSDRDQRHQIYRDRYESKLTAFADTSIRFVDQGGQIMPSGTMVPQHLWDFDYSW